MLNNPMKKFHSARHGSITWAEELRPKSEKAEVTAYFRGNEMKWKYFRRDPIHGGWYDKEEDWNDYIIGGGSFRIDMEQPVEWFNYTLEAKHALIEREIDDYYSADDLPNFHVEPVDIDKNYEHWSNEHLWELQKTFHSRIGKLKLELRDLEREYGAMWRVGDEKYNWEDNF
jgi:hypothetical protein